MRQKNNSLQWFLIITVFVVLVVATAGCGSVQHTANFESDFLPKPDTKIEVGAVTNDTGQTFDIDVSKMFASALSEALGNGNLLWIGNPSGHFIITSKLVEYDKGNAFKRWLLPGWGATVVSVHCDVKESTSGKIIGSVDARRTVSVGGGYTIGAWETIFASVAKDVVDELRSKIGR